MQPQSSTVTTTAWKNSSLILSESSDFSSILWFIYMYVDTAFSRRDIPTEVYEQVY